MNDTTKGTGRLIVYKASESQPKDRRRHYIPAHLIGSFSSNGVLLPKRNRPICVVRLATQQTRTDLAKNVGLKKGIYGYGKGSTFDHDDMFKSSEKGSGQPVDNLAAASFDKLLADDWIHLADYVASQITRGPDAEYELEANIQREGWDASRVSMGYPMNYLRISTAVIRAEWEFVKNPENNFVLGDRGIAGFYDARRNSYGYFMPLRRGFGIRLYKAPFDKSLEWRENAWYVNIPVTTVDPSEANGLNRLTYMSSRAEVYGSNANQLLGLYQECKDMPQDAIELTRRYDGAQYLGLTIQERMEDEMLLTALSGGLAPPIFGEVLRRKV